MALWDAAANIAGLPLHRFLARRLGREAEIEPGVRVYAAGGYMYPQDDTACLSDRGRRAAAAAGADPSLRRDQSAYWPAAWMIGRQRATSSARNRRW